jgi:hypothetical protein
MNIHALTVAVKYADFLALGIERWQRHLSSWTIVTDTQDEETVELARRYGLTIHRTDVFYAKGAAFNKGAALEEARIHAVPWEDWFLLIDADVVPEKDWRARIESIDPQPGRLHGCWRLDANTPFQIDDPRVPRISDDRIGYGYFQLFHTSDPVARRRPLLDTHWTHAGNYDSTLLLSWKTPPVEVPLKLWHVGGVSHNWFGRGEREQFLAMERERRRRGGGWASIEQERISFS